jgi:hypothetical protein
MTFDPLGQAERLQGYNPNTGTSLADFVTGSKSRQMQ